MNFLRKKAIMWWNDLSHDQRLYQMKMVNSKFIWKGRNPDTLTGREIQQIYIKNLDNL